MKAAKSYSNLEKVIDTIPEVHSGCELQQSDEELDKNIEVSPGGMQNILSENSLSNFGNMSSQ